MKRFVLFVLFMENFGKHLIITYKAMVAKNVEEYNLQQN